MVEEGAILAMVKAANNELLKWAEAHRYKLSPDVVPHVTGVVLGAAWKAEAEWEAESTDVGPCDEEGS